MSTRRNHPRLWLFGNRRGWAVLLCLGALAWAGVAAAALAPPQNPSPFDMTGFIQAATLDTTCATPVLCGGTITVNDQLIIVPANTILQMPAAALTWQQVFAQAPAAYKLLNQTGLALSDGNLTAVPPGTTPPPLGTYEVHVIGNRVGDSYIAGLLFLSQTSLQSGQGFINYIDGGTGVFEVGGLFGVPNTGQRVVINDPAGKFGRSTCTNPADLTTCSVDPRFTIDENNPTIRSGTGYPMCIPRTLVDDPLCPQKNRPLDTGSPSGFAMTFQYPTVAAASALPLGPDPRLMAPFEVGDYVTYSGILLADQAPLTTTTIAAYQVIGNVGLFTAPATLASPNELAYVATDVFILGVGGLTVPGLAEATVRTRFEGFTTDPSRNILLYGIDVDACAGTPTPRAWGAIGVDQGAAAGGAVLGRWRFRPPCTAVGTPTDKACTPPPAGSFLPATREMRATIETFPKGSGVPSGAALDALGAVIPGSNLYQAPIFEFLFPENAGFVGTPVVPNNFEAMPFLAQGSGPLGGPVVAPAVPGPVVGQLNPWPGLTAPPLASCGSVTANAGPNQTVASGALVTLTGTGTGSAPLSFNWTLASQTGGTPNPVTLAQNATSGVATFTAPTVSVGVAATLTFNLVVTDGTNATSTPSTVTITVNPQVSDVVSIGLVEYRIGKQRLIINASSTASTAVPPARLFVQAFDANGVGQSLNGTTNPVELTLSGGLYILDIVGAAQPATVKVTSDHGGSAVSGITRLRL